MVEVMLGDTVKMICSIYPELDRKENAHYLVGLCGKVMSIWNLPEGGRNIEVYFPFMQKRYRCHPRELIKLKTPLASQRGQE